MVPNQRVKVIKRNEINEELNKMLLVIFVNELQMAGFLGGFFEAEVILHKTCKHRPLFMTSHVYTSI